MPRRSVTLDELFAVLDAEYKRARSPLCHSCVTPLPSRRAPPDEVSANWCIVDFEDCDYRCRELLAEIVVRLMNQYELKRSVFGVKRKPAKAS